MRTGAGLILSLLGCAAVACVGDIGGGAPDRGEPTSDAESCVAGRAARSPLRRLSRAEYRATVSDLLDVEPPSLDDFVDDEVHNGFDRNVTAASELAVDRYRAQAESLAADARVRFVDLVPCEWEETACAESWLASFGMRAMRRPLEPDELGSLVALYEAERAASDATTALELAVESLLVSPHFLYHVEIGSLPDASGSALLTPYETASRLSYFLWGTMPDDALFAAAADGTLDSRDGVESEARRMLEDPKAEQMLREFQRQWLDLRRIDDFARDPEAFPDWDAAMLESMKLETQTFFQKVILEGDGRLETLLTAPYSYTDAALAEHYGATPNATDFEQTALPAEERAGFMTQGLFLAMHAYPSDTSWVHRGKFVRERLFCSPMPTPPPGVDTANTNDPNRLTNPDCSGCHLLMDPIGKAFDRYDAIGRYAETDAEGVAIPQSGEVVGSEVGTFDSIVSLAGELAADAEVHTCFAETFVSYALARTLEGDTCSTDAIFDSFDASGHDVRELMVAIATSDAFRFTSAE